MDEAVQFVAARLQKEGGVPSVIATVNAQFVCIANGVQRFANFISNADLVVADGASVVAASRMLGKPLPERVAGVDLVKRMCAAVAKTGHSVYLLGGRPEAAAKAEQTLYQWFPKLRIAGIDCPKFGFNEDPVANAEALERIRKAFPDILFVALGAPKQEFWIEENFAELPTKVVIGVGGSFDMLTGIVRRAPVWVQRIGMEWAFRFLQEPGRLWKRYLIGNLRFLQIVAWQRMTQGAAH